MGKFLKNGRRIRLVKIILNLMISFLLLTLPFASATFPPHPDSWTVHRGNWENQGINPKSSSPVTSHELWNNTTASQFTCDPVAANVSTGTPPFIFKRNLVYTGAGPWLIAWDGWNGRRIYSQFNMSWSNINQIVVDDPFIIIKTSNFIMAFDPTLTWNYWTCHSVPFHTVGHVNETAGHITPLLNRIQLVQHQTIVGIVNGSDANYTPPDPYNGHRAYRADYDTKNLSCIWYRNLNSKVESTPVVYLNISGYGGNNTTIGQGIDIPGYGDWPPTPIPPNFAPFNVGNRIVLFFTIQNWLYSLRADTGTYAIIQDAVAHNASLTNPRHVSLSNVNPTWTSPVVMYHTKTLGNNSFGGGDGSWNSGQTFAVDAVYFITGDGYANGICLKDHTNLHRGWYLWNEINFNFTAIAVMLKWYQSFAVDESLNTYNDNPVFNESFLYIGNSVGWFYQIKSSNGLLGCARNLVGANGWFFGVDSPIFNKGRIYVLMHTLGTFKLKIEVLSKLNLNTFWNREYIPMGVPSNLTGVWNPEPCLAFDAVYICSAGMTNPNIWAQRDNEPPVVNCGETVIYPVIGHPYTFSNATGHDWDGTIVNWTWDFHWGYKYTKIATFTFWANQSATGYLTARDDDGATTTDSFTIIPALPAGPHANISWDGHVDIFNNTQIFDGTGSTGTNLTWWNWSIKKPDLTYWYDNGTDQTITYTFTVPQHWYNVTLRLEDGWGQVGRCSVLVYVFVSPPPVANISWDGWAVINVTDVFNGSGSAGTNITYWNWTMEDTSGGFTYDNGTHQTFAFLFTDLNGTYNITLRVEDEWGQWDDQTIEIQAQLTERPDINWMHRPTSGFVGKVLVYEFNTTNISRVIWSWGDGTANQTGYDGNASHIWHKWGIFTVTVTVYNIQNISNTTSFQVSISIFDWSGFMHKLVWILLIIVILLVIKYIIKVWKSNNDTINDI